jgi:hypothetical protein
MRKYVVAHIHEDIKFINDTDRFIGANLINKIIYINDKEQDLSNFNFGVKKLNKKDRFLIEKLLKELDNPDMIVLYSLSELSFSLINVLSDKVIIGWRFFGSELYGKILKDFLTDKTLAVLKKNSPIHIKLKKQVMKFYLNLKRRRRVDDPTKKIQRIDVFMGLYEEEYNLLKHRFEYLPPAFIKLSIDSAMNNYLPDLNKKSTIIIGNSRNLWNNHLDILEYIQENHNSSFKLIVPFNYGEGGNYSKIVRESAERIPNTEVLNKFLSADKYDSLYNDVAALVINSQRQMAVGNILTSLRKGVKVYLNKKNSYYTYLQKIGFIIFTIDHFKKDYVTGEIQLNNEHRLFNYRKLRELEENYTKEDFQKEILSFIKNHKGKGNERF